jgi:hypothetical protein
LSSIPSVRNELTGRYPFFDCLLGAYELVIVQTFVGQELTTLPLAEVNQTPPSVVAECPTFPLPDRVHALPFWGKLTILTAKAHHIDIFFAEYCSSVCCSYHLTAELAGVAADVTGVSIAYFVKPAIKAALFFGITEILYGKIVLGSEVGVLVIWVVDYLIADEFPFF